MIASGQALLLGLKQNNSGGNLGPIEPVDRTAFWTLIVRTETVGAAFEHDTPAIAAHGRGTHF